MTSHNKNRGLIRHGSLADKEVTGDRDHFDITSSTVGVDLYDPYTYDDDAAPAPAPAPASGSGSGSGSSY